MRRATQRLVRKLPYLGSVWSSRDQALQDIATLQEALAACERSRDEHRAALDRVHQDFAEYRRATESRWANADFNSDGLVCFDRSLDFLTDERFRRAYHRGMNSGHHLGEGINYDLGIEYRVYMILWAAHQAMRLEGDFVECGVNTGMYGLAICDYFDWNSRSREFWLFDTFNGIPESMITERERQLGRANHNGQHFSDCYELVQHNFRDYTGIHIVRGEVPATLAEFPNRRVAYLSIDMNIVEPEIAAIEFFWDRLIPSAVVVLDDYGWAEYRPQKEAMDDFAQRKGIMIATLPTGQGLIVK